jgi:hypothetical protein
MSDQAVKMMEALVLGCRDNLRLALDAKRPDEATIREAQRELRVAKQILKRERERAGSMKELTDVESMME